MDAFSWDIHFVTGLKDVDEQHQYLVKLINQFGAQVAANQLDLEQLEQLFQELYRYSEYHFREEEGGMQQAGIDPRHLDAHMHAHDDFLQQVTGMHAALDSNDPEAAKHILDFLVHWLVYHILGLDQNMARQMQAIDSGMSASAAYEVPDPDINGATEILLHALNGLFKQVSERNKALAELNQSLEQKVVQRTKALSEANLRLEELSLTDVLTGLPNRRHAMRQLDSLWEEALKFNLPLASMMIDADHFKEINDTYGHDAGDEVLRQLATALQHAVRTDDLVCRLGGDEFLIICPNTDQRGGLYIAEQVHAKVSSLQVVTGKGQWQGSVSVGVSSRTADMQHYEALIKLADNGVYEAKRAGKNCVKSICSDS